MNKNPDPNNPLTGRKQNPEHIRKRVESRLRNGNYVGKKGPENNLFGKPSWNHGKKGLQSHSPETRKLMSDLKIGYIPWNKGKKGLTKSSRKGTKLPSHTKEHNEKIRQTLLKRFADLHAQGKKSHKYGTTQTEQTKSKIRKARSEQIFPVYDTKPERMMQIALALNGIIFEKQKLFKLGRYWHRVDIFIEPNICVEVDGVHWHIEEKDVKRDLRQTQALTIMGYHIIRIRDKDILKDINHCAERVVQLIKELTLGTTLITNLIKPEMNI